jgi:hypothetical protein
MNRTNTRRTRDRELTNAQDRALIQSGLSIPQARLNPTNFLQCRYYGIVTNVIGTEAIATINAQDLLRAPGVVATSSSTAYAIAQAVKIKRVWIWSSPILGSSSSSSSPTTVGIVWYNFTGRSNNQVVSDTSLNPACPAHVCVRPPRDSFNRLWYSNSTDNMFDIVLTGNSASYSILVQVDIDWVASNQTLAPVSVTTSNTMTVGDMYYTPLDGVSTHAFLRQGLPSIY